MLIKGGETRTKFIQISSARSVSMRVKISLHFARLRFLDLRFILILVHPYGGSELKKLQVSEYELAVGCCQRCWVVQSYDPGQPDDVP
jgi:hypothetical protein